MKRIACIGECMIELWQEPQRSEQMHRTFGGDTLNTAVYAARCLSENDARVSYVTALGDDPFSDELISAWQAEGLDTSLVARLPGKLPGLYIIRTDDDGERSFYYWREQAAARELFHCEKSDDIIAKLVDYNFVYLSGITLAIFAATGRKRLLTLLDRIRDNGGQVAFDSNYRPRLWPDARAARTWMEQVLRRTDLAFPTFDDEAALWGDSSPEGTGERLQALGVAEIVVKCGGEPCWIVSTDEQRFIATDKVSRVVDTTAAGDAFNAAYFSARLLGEPSAAAACAGHRLAAKVIQHHGAIIPS